MPLKSGTVRNWKNAMTRKSWPPEEMTVSERIKVAREKTKRLVDHLIGLVALNEANQIVVYSDRLSGQIPRSYAANAFNTFQRTSLFFELIRLCAIWDKVGEHRESIPTVINLIDRPDVIATLKAEIEAQWNGAHVARHEDRQIAEMIARSERRFGKSQGKKLISRLRYSIRRTQEIEQGQTLSKLVNFRDKHLAHALAKTYREAQGNILALPKMGDERTLLRASTSIVRNLYLGISNTDFNFAESREIARMNAAALWHGCSFDIKG
jgi:hypothetical protein